MTTKAKASKGTLLQIGDGAGSETFATIGEILSFKIPGVKNDVIDVTSMDDAAKEFISSGITDGGELTFELNFAGPDTQQQQLRTDAIAGTLRNFKALINDHASVKTTFNFSAFITEVGGVEAGVGEQYKMSITAKVSGLATFSYAS